MNRSPEAIPLLIRPMEVADVPAVVAIEDASFSTRWERTAYERELANSAARYLVMDRPGEDGGAVIGFAGLWLVVDEAHVVTVAVRPDRRRRGYGRLLLHELLRVAMDLSLARATLECRVSNAAARALYREYGFYEVGARVRYYSDNGEDAVIMTTEDLATEAYQARYQRLAGLLPAGPTTSTVTRAGR